MRILNAFLWSTPPVVAVTFDAHALRLLQLSKTKQQAYAAEILLLPGVAEAHTIIDEPAFIEALHQGLSRLGLRQARLAISIPADWIHTAVMQVPLNLNALEIDAYVRFELAEAGLFEQDAIYLDVQDVGTVDQRNVQYFAVTRDRLEPCLHVFEKAKCPVTVVDIDAFVVQTALSPIETPAKIRLDNDLAWQQACCLAIRVRDFSSINLLPHRQTRQADLRQKAHLRFYTCLAISMVFIALFDLRLYQQRRTLGAVVDKQRGTLKQHQLALNKIKQYRTMKINLEGKIHRLHTLQRRQKNMVDWLDDLITRLPTHMALLSLHQKKEQVLLLGRAESMHEVTKLLQSLAQSPCVVQARLLEVKQMLADGWRYPYLFKLTLNLNRCTACRLGT